MAIRNLNQFLPCYNWEVKLKKTMEFGMVGDDAEEWW